jgi:hypothetical protein
MSLLLPDATFERHYSIAELARLWRISRETVRLLIKDEPGVIRIQLGQKRLMCRYSVPESVARRIHARLTAPAFVHSQAA